VVIQFVEAVRFTKMIKNIREISFFKFIQN